MGLGEKKNGKTDRPDRSLFSKLCYKRVRRNRIAHRGSGNKMFYLLQKKKKKNPVYLYVNGMVIVPLNLLTLQSVSCCF